MARILMVITPICKSEGLTISKCNIEWSKKVDPATGDRKGDNAHARYTQAKLGDLCFNCGEKGHYVKNCPFT